MPKNSKQKKSLIFRSVIAIILVALSYAVLNIAARLMNQGIQPMTQVYLRIGLAFIVSTIIFNKRIRWQNIFKMSLRDFVILTVMGTVGYSIGVYFLTQGALQTKLVNISVIYSTGIFFGYIYSIIFLKNKINLKLICLIFLSLLGTIFIASNSFMPSFGQFGVGDIFVLLGAITMSVYYVGRQMLSKNLNNEEITIVSMLIAAICSIILASISGEHLNISAFFNYEILIGLALGTILNITSTYFGNFGFEHINVVVGNQILLTENIFAVVLGYFLYHEVLTIPEVVGAIIVIISVMFGIKLIHSHR